jgi:ATP-dependent DNA helicase RecG
MSGKRSINPIDILEKLDWHENNDLEFKSAKGGVPKSVWETYSAMANTHGGVILLGVENDGTVSGVIDPDRLKKSFWDTINNRGKVSVNLLVEVDVAEVEHEQGVILAIRVPQAGRYQRPVFLEKNPLTGTYRRNFEGDYHCTEQEVSRMLSDRAEEPADSRILEHFTLDDLDQTSVQQYRQRFSSHKPTHPWLSEDDKGLLAKLGGWRRDRKKGQEGLTVAGLLMFGKDEAIREALPQYHVDYREKLSDDPLVRWTDRLTMDGTWAGNLFQFYLRVIQRLAADLKLPFQLDRDLFRKGEAVVHEAIREALVNALIHADYQGQGGIIVEKYSDRFEFSNPGSLLISFDQLLRGNVSECRNKSLQIMFMLLGAAEKAGSGVDKIRRGWESQHWRSPLIREQVQPDRVQWVLPMISLIPEESLQRLEALFGRKFHRFSQQEIQALVTADIEGAVDNSRLRQITAAHAADMTRVLQGLVGKGALTQEGQGRWTRYRLPAPPHSLHKGSDSIHKDLDSIHKRSDSIHKDGDSLFISEFSSAVDDELHHIAKPAIQRKRIDPKEMGKILLQLCRGRWLSRSQISKLLNRNPESLRQRFLNPMVEHGLLQLRYPDKPNRTDQAYTTAKETD